MTVRETNGQCDVCGRTGLLHTHWVVGIETHACTLCSGDDELQYACPDCDGTGWLPMRPEDQRPHGCDRCENSGIIWLPATQV